jgi:hypothetical protein
MAYFGWEVEKSKNFGHGLLACASILLWIIDEILRRTETLRGLRLLSCLLLHVEIVGEEANWGSSTNGTRLGLCGLSLEADMLSLISSQIDCANQASLGD